MFDNKLTIPFRGTALTLSEDEATELLEGIAKEQRRLSEEKRMELNKVTVVDGYISREAVEEFFSQIYSEQPMLQSHVGRLMGRFPSVAWRNEGLIKTRCLRCGLSMERVCTSTSSTYAHRHSTSEMRYMAFSAKSLKRLSVEEFMNAGSNAGPVIQSDFELLKSYL